MKVLARRRSATFLKQLEWGEFHSAAFDGYTFTVNFRTLDGRDVRLELERHEATRIGAYITEQIAKQRAQLEELERVTDALA